MYSLAHISLFIIYWRVWLPVIGGTEKVSPGKQGGSLFMITAPDPTGGGHNIDKTGKGPAPSCAHLTSGGRLKGLHGKEITQSRGVS